MVPLQDSTSSNLVTAARREAPVQATVMKARPLPNDTVLFSDTLGFVAVPEYSLPYRDTSMQRSLQDTTGKSIHTTVLFGQHALKPKHAGPVERTAAVPGWLFPVLLTMMVVFTGLRLFYSRYFKQMAASLFNVNLANQIVRDENILVQRATVYMSIMFYLTAALFLYFLSEQRNWAIPWAGSGFLRFISFVVLVSAVYAAKFLVLRFCGWLFGLEKELTAYLFTIFIVNNIQGLLLFPFIVLMSYNPGMSISWMISVCLFLVGSLYVFRLFRGVQIGLNVPGTSLLHLFLYLCTLELAPLLVVFRIAGIA
jgi:hypothetical protein